MRHPHLRSGDVLQSRGVGRGGGQVKQRLCVPFDTPSPPIASEFQKPCWSAAACAALPPSMPYLRCAKAKRSRTVPSEQRKRNNRAGQGRVRAKTHTKGSVKARLPVALKSAAGGRGGSSTDVKVTPRYFERRAAVAAATPTHGHRYEHTAREEDVWLVHKSQVMM